MVKDLLVPIEKLNNTNGKRIDIDSSKTFPLLLELASLSDENANVLIDQTNRHNIKKMPALPRRKVIDINLMELLYGNKEEIEDNSLLQRNVDLVVTHTSEGKAFVPGLEVAALKDKHLNILLNEIDIPDDVKKGIREIREKIDPDTTLTHLRQAKKGEIDYEGRGVYVKYQANGTEIIVYLKGGGSQYINIDESKPYPAYPNNAKELFFDDIESGTQHPRIVGTESWQWGMMEYVNLHVLLEAAYKQGMFSDFKDLIDKKIPFPIAVTQLPELTNYLKQFVDELRIKYRENPIVMDSLNWQGLKDNLVICANVVPGTKRYERISDLYGVSEKTKNNAELMIDKKRAKKSAALLKQMIKMGIIFSYESAHGQNIYDADSALPLADYSDFLLIGNYQGGEFEDPHDEESSFYLDSHTVRSFAIEQTLSRHDGMRPPIYIFSKLDLNYKQVFEAQKVYLTELLSDFNFDEKLIDKITNVSLISPTAIDRYISKLLETKYQSKEWDRVAKLQHSLIKNVDNNGILESELKQKIDSNISYYSLKEIKDNEFHPIYLQKEILALFEGDEELLKQNPHMGELFKLMETILNLDDDDEKGKLFEALQKVSFSRNLDKFTQKLWFRKEYSDTIHLFDYQHIKMADALIKSNKIQEAILLLNSISKLGTNHMRNQYSYSNPVDGNLLLADKYAERLLEADDLQELEEIENILLFIQKIDNISDSAIGGFGKVLSEVFKNTDEQSEELDIYEFVEENNYTNPHTLFAFIKQIAENKQERERVNNIIDKNQEEIREWLEYQGYDEKNPSEKIHIEMYKKETALYDELDENPSNLLLKFFCRLRTLKNSTDFVTDEGIQLHKQILKWIKDFFNTNHETLVKEFKINEFFWMGDYKLPESNRSNQEISKRFKQKGFPKLAKFYDKEF